jgi:hypothetical protein
MKVHPGNNRKHLNELGLKEKIGPDQFYSTIKLRDILLVVLTLCSGFKSSFL